jgi:hypothetical protein
MKFIPALRHKRAPVQKHCDATWEDPVTKHSTQHRATACIPVQAGFIDDAVHIYSKETITLAFEFIHEALRWTLVKGSFIKIHIGLAVGL